MRKPHLTTLAILAALCGCASRARQVEHRVTYACDRGPDLVVAYFDGVARIESGDGGP